MSQKQQVTVDEVLHNLRFQLRAVELRGLEKLEFFKELNKEFGNVSRKECDDLHTRLQGEIPKLRVAKLRLEKDELELVQDVSTALNKLEPASPRDLREIVEFENMLGQRTEQALARLISKYVPEFMERFEELWPDSGYLPKREPDVTPES